MIYLAQYEVNNSTISTLLSWVKNGEVAIPEIQRPFVWNSTKVRDLVDSIYAGFPIGYIIVWKNPDIKLKDGTISNGKKILIDGQQRITALRAAILGLPVIKSDYGEKKIKIAFNPITEKFEVANSAIEKNWQWIQDISVLFPLNFDSLTFVMDYSEKNNLDNKQRSEVNKIINKLRGMPNNNVGIIELDSQLDIEQVTEIFIRINSKGVVLSQADFAMSKIASDSLFDGNTIRKIIDYFCHLQKKPEDKNKIEENDPAFAASDEYTKIRWIAKEKEDIYVPDYTDVLRVAFAFKFLRGRLSDLVSLLSGRDFTTREYKEEIAEQAFNKLKESVLAFVNESNFKRYIMIVESTGIKEASMIRSQNVLNFGYALYLLLRSKHVEDAIIGKVVRRWLVLSILTGRYSGSAESMFDYDIKRFDSNDVLGVLEHIEAGELSDAFWNNIILTKLETSVASSPMFNVFLMAQVKMGDKGFLSDHIEVESLIKEHGDIHHIFPKKYLQKNGVNLPSRYNQIANYVYTQTEINIKIKDDAPNVYMQKVKDACQAGSSGISGLDSMEELRENIAANCIPEAIFNMDCNEYDDFLAARRKLMAEKIRKYYEGLK